MNADCKGALRQINKSWKAFIHNGKPMTKAQVKSVLEFAVKKGYDHTGQLTDEDINTVLGISKPVIPTFPPGRIERGSSA